MAWQTFATKTSPNPMSTLDTQSSNLSAMGIVDCTASGTNVITLTPILSGYTGPAYANNVKYGFLAANTTSGATTLKVGSLAAINVYQIDGTTQVTTGGIVAGQYYVVAYNAALNSAAGGWIILNNVLVIPVSVANGGTGLATLTAHNVMIGNGTSNVAFVAPGTNGNVLTSDGTDWTSATASSGGSVVWLAQLTASASATLVDTTHITSTYNDYLFTFKDILPATDVTQLLMRVSVDGGSTYASTAYIGGVLYTGFTAGVVETPTSTTDLLLSGSHSEATGDGISNTAGYGYHGYLYLTNPNSTARKRIYGQFMYGKATPFFGGMGGFYDGNGTAVNAVQFRMSSGNLTSGTINIYGIKNS